MKTYDTHIPEITLKYKSGDVKKVKITSSGRAYDVFIKIFDLDTIEIQESFVMILLNAANKTIGWYKVSQGGITGTIIDPRLIFSVALKAGASGIIVAHNHPSGSVKASKDDIVLSKQLKVAGDIICIRVLDSLIISEKGYFSLGDEGLLEEK